MNCSATCTYIQLSKQAQLNSMSRKWVINFSNASSHSKSLRLNIKNNWKSMGHTQHCSYWWPGALVPGHQYPQCWLNIHCIGPVSYKNIRVELNNMSQYNYILKKKFPVVKGLMSMYQNVSLRPIILCFPSLSHLPSNLPLTTISSMIQQILTQISKSSTAQRDSMKLSQLQCP